MSADPIAPLAWVDVTTFDRDAAAAFHVGLFGCTREELAMADAPGYSLYRSAGEVVAAIDPIPPEKGPPRWTVFVEVLDLDRALGRVEEAGGKVVLARAPIPDHGALALATDPAGAEFGLWLALGTAPARGSLPGSLVGAELHLPDPAAASDFYGAAFNWRERPAGIAGRAPFLDAGGLPARLVVSDEAPGWTPWLGAEDVGATVSKAVESGAMVIDGAGGVPIVSWTDDSSFGLSSLRGSTNAQQTRDG